MNFNPLNRPLNDAAVKLEEGRRFVPASIAAYITQQQFDSMLKEGQKPEDIEAEVLLNRTLRYYLGFLAISLLPFMICELYWGFNDISCQNQSTNYVQNQITIGTWLKVDGFVLLSQVVFILSALCSGLDNSCCCICSGCISFFLQIVLSCWLGLGCVLFWAGKNNAISNGDCGKQLNVYIWTRLILGIIVCACVCVGAEKQKAAFNKRQLQ